MQHCTNELYWMDQQAEERINYDWSDANLDYPARQRHYEVAEQTQKGTVWMWGTLRRQHECSLANSPSSTELHQQMPGVQGGHHHQTE